MDSFEQESSALGFPSPEAFIVDLYHKSGFSMRNIAEMSGWKIYRIRRVLKERGVVRDRGGSNNLGNTKLREVPTSEFVEGGLQDLAKKYGCSVSTVYAEYKKRRREGEQQLRVPDPSQDVL